MIALDATVVRTPFSGVHYAVRHQVQALLQYRSAAQSLVFAHDADWRKTLSRDFPDLNCPPLPSRLSLAPYRIFWQQLQLPARLRRANCQALLAPAYTAPWRCPVPYLLQVHDTVALRRPELCRHRNWIHMQLLMPPSIWRAAGILTPSTRVADDLMRLFHLPVSRIQRVPLGVDPLFLAAPEVRPLPLKGLQKGENYFLFVGTLEPKKGLETLLTAYARAAERGLKATLVLAGRIGWKCHDILTRIKQWSGPGRVLYAGYLQRAVLPSLYQQAKAVIMPSEEEGFGLPVLEAMACRTPVIHSSDAALTETAGGHGLSFPRRDADALTNQLLRIQNDSPAVDLAAAAQWAEQHTWQNWAAVVSERLDSLVPPP